MGSDAGTRRDLLRCATAASTLAATTRVRARMWGGGVEGSGMSKSGSLAEAPPPWPVG